MSAALTVRLPDLWLKRAMALKLLPVVENAAKVQNAWFVRCIRDADGREALFSQWLSGDTTMRVADDVQLLAATLELLILNGNPADIDHESAKAHLNAGGGHLKSGLLGTFGEFAGSLDHLLQARADYQELGGAEYVRHSLTEAVRTELLGSLEANTEKAGSIQILHGNSRDWVGSIAAGEKIIRQPKNDKLEKIAKGDFVQFVVPPTIGSRFMFGFELRMDDGLVSHPWEDAGSWLGTRLQVSGKATLLFDDPVQDKDAPFADVEGTFAARLVSVDAGLLSDFAGICDHFEPNVKTKGLVDGCPTSWPDGYAKSIALVTYVKRAADRAKRARNKNELEAKRSATFIGQSAVRVPEPSIPLLHQGSYLVV